MGDPPFIENLIGVLRRIPSIRRYIGGGVSDDGSWWVKFAIDTAHPLAWRTVQELGHVLNYLSINERLPTVFMPVSPPPYLNGGPEEFLSWVIECRDPVFSPADAAIWLEDRLPEPIEDASSWAVDDEV